MIDTQKYDSYSVGAYTVRGNEIGGEYASYYDQGYRAGANDKRRMLERRAAGTPAAGDPHI